MAEVFCVTWKKMPRLFVVWLSGICGGTDDEKKNGAAAGRYAAWHGGFCVNPDGGRYMHADRRCDAMSEKYWAILQETTPQEAQQRGMRRCERCMKEDVQPSELLASGAVHLADQATHSGENAVYTLGGSEADVIHDVAAMPDGGALLAGFTMSHDGTLGDRTKTGRTGWLCRVDAKGNTLWNFCSRRGSNDYMRAPVVHEDGSITALLAVEGSERNQVELIRLTAQGEVMSRKIILEMPNAEGSCLIEEPGVFAGGYVLAGADNERFLRITYRWYDFKGQLIKTVEKQWDGAVMAVSSGHIIEVHDGAYWLCSLDEKGSDTRLCRLLESDGRDYHGRMTFTSLASLPDGGALACMRQGKEESRIGRLIRFGADGSVVWQLDLGKFSPDDVRVTEDGFAMTGEAHTGQYRIYWGDQAGTLKKYDDISKVFDYNTSCPMAILSDGRAAVAGAVWGAPGKKEWVNYDVELNVVR